MSVNSCREAVECCFIQQELPIRCAAANREVNMCTAGSAFSFEQDNRIEFALTEQQFRVFLLWAKAIDSRVFQEQLAGEFRPVMPFNSPETMASVQEICRTCATQQGRAYYGATDSAYRFSFTPSGLGVSLVVENIWTGERLDLTREENW